MKKFKCSRCKKLINETTMLIHAERAIKNHTSKISLVPQGELLTMNDGTIMVDCIAFHNNCGGLFKMVSGDTTRIMKVNEVDEVKEDSNDT